ncbi:MAG: helix-turn-helix domain-containing protein [Pelolinea sp.]|nr:helix-turn-helix domain-containing protein [Pelolinea sp.]
MENKYLQNTLLKPRDAAQMLNISRSLVYQLIRSGEIPVVRIKSTVRIKAKDLEVFIEKSQHQKDIQLSLF